MGDSVPSMSSCRSSSLSFVIVVTVGSGDWRTGQLTGDDWLIAVPAVVGGVGFEVDVPVSVGIGVVGVEAGTISDGRGTGVETVVVGCEVDADDDLLTKSSPIKMKTPRSLWSSSILAMREAT